MSSFSSFSTSSIRRQLYHILDVVLRVPPIFIMDSIFVNSKYLPPFYDTIVNTMLNRSDEQSSQDGVKSSSMPTTTTTAAATTAATINIPTEGDDRLNVSMFQSLLYLTGNNNQSLPVDTNQLSNQSNGIGLFTIVINNSNASTILLFITYALVFSISFCLFLLTTKHLIRVYKWFTSIAIVIWSYFLNISYVNYIESKTNDTKFQEFSLSDGIFYTFITNYMLQVTLSITFIYVSGQHMNFAASIAAFFFILPCLTSVSFFMTNKILVYLPTITLLISLIYIFVSLALNVREILKALYVQFMWIKTFVRNYGLYILLESQWTRLHVPQVLRVFWLTRLTEQASFLYFLGPNLNSLYNYNFPSLTMMESPAIIGLKYLLVRGCDNVIAVLGMTSVLSGISHQIGCMMQLFLVVEDPEDRSIGAVSAILFFILALQNGLTAMEPEKRFMRLYRNVCLLFTAILHFIHNMVSPLLFSLSASRNMSINRHCRALIVCIFLFISPIVFLYYLWAHHSLSTWLLAVTAFSFEVIIKVVISLLIYTLFMIDAFRSSMWEQLDDYVYYIRATGNSIEFIFGIFLFFNGAWILLFESGGTIRALMMCIHAYFNIWCQAIAGWKTFIKRRHAVHKINSLPEASAEQLRNFDDVCAICYQELTTARITRCKHYFHSVCLRKWLYLQDICPLCHKTLYNVEQTDGETNSAAPGQAGDPIHVNQPNRLEPLNRDDEVVGRTPEQTNRHEHDD